MPEMAPRILLLALLTSVMPSGAQVTPVLTYYSRECEAPLGPWKNFVIFGKRGTSLRPAYKTTLLISSLRAIIEEEYAKRLTKLAKLALGRDEIGYVSIWPGTDNLRPY
jgi:hypothetical protein